MSKRRSERHCGGVKTRPGRLRLLVVIVFAMTALAAEAENNPPVRSVLILYSFGREFAPFSIMASTFRTELATRSPQPIEFHEAALETARFSEEANEQPLVEYLQALFSRRQPDLIVALGGPATFFVNRHRDQLFPEVPMIATMDWRRIQKTGGSTNMAVVPLQLDLPGLMEDILQTLPATTNVAVVMGTTPFERYWTEQCKRDFAPFTNRINFSYLNDLSLEQICRKARALPPNSAIFWGALVKDAAGVPHEQETALVTLHLAANAPIFGAFEHQLGLGIVGGRLVSNEAWGRRAADAALRILDGEPASQIVSEPTRPGAPVYDWRELRRWNIGYDRLMPGFEIRFRKPTQWEQHKWAIIGSLALMLVETALIAGLILELRLRRRAEASAREAERAAGELSGRLIHTQEDERSRIARDLHDDFNQRLALLSVEIDMLSQKTESEDAASKLKRLGEHANELASDVHRLAYQLHPAKLDQLGLVATVSGHCRDLAKQSSLKITFTQDGVPQDLSADRARCVFRVIQESLHNVVRHSGAQEAKVEMSAQDGRIRVLVSDAGKGFDLEAARNAGGLGLLSMRERVRLSRGKLDIHSQPGQGTRVELTIPLRKKEEDE